MKIVTFGGEGKLSSPALYYYDGNFSRPATQPWDLPNLPRTGPAVSLESFRNAVWFSLKNTGNTASGVGKVFLFATPEELVCLIEA